MRIAPVFRVGKIALRPAIGNYPVGDFAHPTQRRVYVTQ